MASSVSVPDVGSGRWRRRAQGVGVGAAVAASIAVWSIADPLLGEDLVVQQPGKDPMDLGFGAILTFSLLPSLAGWGLLAVLERLTSRARAIWTTVAVALLVLSFAPVLSVEATGATKLTLALLHLVVGAALIPVFWRSARTAREPR
ncbi:DUF6069 family protein [Thermomonospora umbrina]|nr:DUF6069 family protein [Thermomonospora umbrina]